MKETKKKAVFKFKKRAVSLELAGPPRWADFFELNWSAERFYIAFVMEGVKDEERRAHTQIVMAPRMALNLRRCLNDAIKDHETKNGPIGVKR